MLRESRVTGLPPPVPPPRRIDRKSPMSSRCSGELHITRYYAFQFKKTKKKNEIRLIQNTNAYVLLRLSIDLLAVVSRLPFIFVFDEIYSVFVSRECDIRSG